MTSIHAPELIDQILDRLRDIVGIANVLTADALEQHRDPYSFLEEEDTVRPAAAVLHDCVEQVQAVIALAVDMGLPLWTISRGRNFAYGGPAARVPGSVVLDLKRMNRVLEIDEDLGYVVVEPGVSFLDLHAYVAACGASLLLSVPDIGWGSVIGNALERGFGYAQYGDHSAHICGLEVAMADGTLLRTGMGALPAGNTGPLYKGGYGPSLEGLFLQSNLGVVTKLGLWVSPRPETVVVCEAAVAADDTLGPLVDAMRPLQLGGTVQSPVVVGNAAIIATATSERERWHNGPGAMSEQAASTMAEQLGVGRWNARFALYGPESLTRVRVEVVRAALGHLPGLELSFRHYPGDVAPGDVHPADLAQLGIPTTAMVRMAAWRGGEPAHTDFSLVCPSRGADVLCQRDLLRAGVERHGFDYAGGFTMFGRHTIALALVSFDRSNAEERSSVRTLFSELFTAAAKAGYAPYRTHTAFMDEVADLYSGNDRAVARTVEIIKDALDPAGVLSPGKQGIWPGRSSPGNN